MYLIWYFSITQIFFHNAHKPFHSITIHDGSPRSSNGFVWMFNGEGELEMLTKFYFKIKPSKHPSFFFFNIRNFIKNKKSNKYTGNVLQWQKSRKQITKINKIGRTNKNKMAKLNRIKFLELFSEIVKIFNSSLWSWNLEHLLSLSLFRIFKIIYYMVVFYNLLCIQNDVISASLHAE